MRTVTETLSVPKSQISKRETLDQSLMPPGLLQSLPDREAVELLMYLTDTR